MIHNDDLITAVCTVGWLEARSVRDRLQRAGLVWSESKRRWRVHFIATGTFMQWRRENDMGGNSGIMFDRWGML